MFVDIFVIKLCQRNPDCQWFTFDGLESTCTLLSDCPTLDTSCTECQTGESDCKGTTGSCHCLASNLLTSKTLQTMILLTQVLASACC